MDNTISRRLQVSERTEESGVIERGVESEFGAPLHVAILLDKKEIVEELVKEGVREADCHCAQHLFNQLNQPPDSLIGKGRPVWAMDIAELMDKEGILNLLARATGREVRCGRTTRCDKADGWPSPFSLQYVSDVQFVACNPG